MLLAHDSGLGPGTFTIQGGELRSVGGVRQIGNPTQFNGSFLLGRDVHFSGPVAIAPAGVTLTAFNPDAPANANVQLTGPISGNGVLTLATSANGLGSGFFVLSPGNTHGGTTLMSGARVVLTDNSQLGDQFGLVTLAGGELHVPASVSSYRQIVAAGGTIAIPDASTKAEFGHLQGSGTLTKTGPGTLRFRVGVSEFQGQLQLNEGVLELESSGSVTSGVISGPGHLVLTNGTVAFTSPQTYTGITQVQGAGRLQIGNGGTTGSIASQSISLSATSTLDFRRSDSYTFGGSLSGGGFASSATQSGGTLTLSAAEHFATTNFTILSGRVILQGQWRGVFSVNSGARLTLAGGSTAGASNNGRLDGSGTIFASLSRFYNTGVVEAGPGQTIVVRGQATNYSTGVLRAVGGGTLDLSQLFSFSNAGVIDRISGNVLLPPGWVNEGVILDSSVVKVKSVARSGSMVTLTIDSHSAHTYQLQRSTDLAGTSFVNVGAAQAGLSGTQLTFVDPAANGTSAFYRVAVD